MAKHFLNSTPAWTCLSSELNILCNRSKVLKAMFCIELFIFRLLIDYPLNDLQGKTSSQFFFFKLKQIPHYSCQNCVKS